MAVESYHLDQQAIPDVASENDVATSITLNVYDRSGVTDEHAPIWPIAITLQSQQSSDGRDSTEQPYLRIVDSAETNQGPTTLPADAPIWPLPKESRETSAVLEWARRHKHGLALGAVTLGAVGLELVLSQASGVSVGNLATRIERNAPWVGASLAVTEAMWVGGLAVAALGAGVKIGNPLFLAKDAIFDRQAFFERLAAISRQWHELPKEVANNPIYRAGVYINRIGALGTAAALAAGTGTTLPPEAWVIPGAVIGSDIAQTVTLGKLLLSRKETKPTPSFTIRSATLEDISDLADLDLRLFDGAYGAQPPTKAEVEEMFTKRFLNNPEGMFVAVVGGQVKGFCTVFRTRAPIESFTSWENSTANGTLDGKVDPKGRYMYVANLTMDTHGASGALDSLLAYAFAKGIEDGVEYGYFCSRMPGFRRWAEREAACRGADIPQGEALDDWAHRYASMRHPVDNAGMKTRPLDPQLAFYEHRGLILTHPVPHAFDDHDSMDYQVPVRADVPSFASWSRRIPPARVALAAILRQAAKHPKLLAKVL